ncbi:GNAT family N-acetyltransferase [Uliginosibacterium paludis]|uniref:GNAT family N-acetyltransferase n=1 Tax=Uliginosibacterium paludis TaxID=1615952 RepID=A0ABV2CNP8_9RHOO
MNPPPMSEFVLPPLSLAGWTVRLLGDADAPLLQAFFDANPDYFQRSDGHAAGPEEAIETLRDAPPPELSWSSKGVFGFFAPDDRLGAMAQVIGGLMVESVWHIGLFILATERHGRGEAQSLVRWLEDLALSRQAHWMRLGVLVKNPRAARFWEKTGYRCVRLRQDVQVGEQRHDVRVMVKPLRGGELAAYLELVARDRPEG